MTTDEDSYSNGGTLEPGMRRIRISASDNMISGAEIKKQIQDLARRRGVTAQPEDPATDEITD